MTRSNSKPLIDQLGRIKAKIAALTLIETGLRGQIVEMGVGAHEGDLFRATVSKSIRETLDMKAVRKKLSPQFIKANTNKTPVITVSVVARTAMNLKEVA